MTRSVSSTQPKGLLFLDFQVKYSIIFECVIIFRRMLHMVKFHLKSAAGSFLVSDLEIRRQGVERELAHVQEATLDTYVI